MSLMSSVFSPFPSPSPSPRLESSHSTLSSSALGLSERLFAGIKGEHDTEWERIVGVPRVTPAPPERVAWLHKDPSKARLRDTQASALATIARDGGFFGPIGVGFGKTLIAWLAPVVLNARAVILMPANMLAAFQKEVDKFRPYFAQPAVEPVLLSYNILSSPTQFDILSKIKPELIVCDEAHTLMNSTSARTKRLLRYFSENPNTRLVAMSGTFFGKKPGDLANLVHFALRDHAFMPVRGRALDTWAQCVNLDGRPSDSDWSAFAPLAKAEGVDLRQTVGEERTKRARAAVLSRMQSSPGVLSTTEPSVEIPLVLCSHTLPVPPEVQSVLQTLEVGAETPDGDDVIIDDAARARLQSHVSVGFYYRWAWEQIGGRDDEWVLARKTWHKALRRELENRSAEGYDSPLLVTNKIKRDLAKDPGLAGRSNLHWAWHQWEPFSRRPVPPTVPVWLSPFYIEWVHKYLAEHPPGTLVWYYSRALGDALGLPLHGQGSEPPTPGVTSAVSIRVHGTGKNLQAHNRNLIAELPSQNKEWEQLIGRTHRPGQPAPAVYIDVPQHTQKFCDTLDRAFAGAEHTKELTAADQRLLMCVRTQRNWT